MKRVAVVRGRVRGDKFFFACRVNRTQIQNVVLDTGAFDFMVSDKIARQLNLSRGTPLLVQGVSGSTRAWKSRCNLAIGGRKFRDVPCVIIKDLPYEALFGLGFFVDNDYKLLLDPKSATMSILR